MQYVRDVEDTKAEATATVGFKPITVQYHGVLTISRLSTTAFNVVMRFMQKLEAGEIAGY